MTFQKTVKLSVVFFTAVFIDQLVKYSIQKGLFFHGEGFFAETCNPYLSWGIPLGGAIFWIFWLVANLLLIYLVLKFNGNIFLFLVLAGSISNAADRVVRGCVVDYIRIPFGNFPLFNLADVFITAGVAAFLLIILFSNNKRPLKKR